MMYKNCAGTDNFGNYRGIGYLCGTTMANGDALLR